MKIARALWQLAACDGRSAQHRYGFAACHWLDQHCCQLPLLRGSTTGGFGSFGNPTRELNGPVSQQR
jgi:hypothetical protein